MNLSASTKKGSVSRSAKKGANVSEVCSDIVPYKGDYSPIGNIVLESTPSGPVSVEECTLVEG